jgi:dTDP-D-glucose 4,6-dehydratase
MRVDQHALTKHSSNIVTNWPSDDRRCAIDASKIGDELGWRPKDAFESGLEKAIGGVSTTSGGGSRSVTAILRALL